VLRSSFAIAPMMGWSDLFFRCWMRCLFNNVDVYTEMVAVNAICYGDAGRLLQEDDHRHVVLQVGGSDPKLCKQAAHIAFDQGFRHIDLNVGCPSSRVQKGMIGAVLMKYPSVVADCVEAMMSVHRDLTVSVKSRIGVDHQDDESFLVRFLDEVLATGCKHVTIHARKAWLSGMSPKDNRNIPLLNYQRVYDMKRRYPDVFMLINGGFNDFLEVKEALNHVDGVMIGRLAIERQRDLVAIARQLGFMQGTVRDSLTRYQQYLAGHAYKNQSSLKPLMALLHGFNGAKSLRSQMAELMRQQGGVSQWIDRLKDELPS